MKILYEDLANFVPALRTMSTKSLLHVGCGTAPASRLPMCFRKGAWKEVRLDIDPQVKPDVVADVCDMGTVPTAVFTATWSSHNLEHLEGHKVSVALAEHFRVLRPGGFALFNVPDLQAVASYISDGNLDDVLYTSPAGPITPLDILFGHQASLARGKGYMSHRTGFTAQRLARVLREAGFTEVRVMRGQAYDLWAIGVKSEHAKL